MGYVHVSVTSPAPSRSRRVEAWLSVLLLAATLAGCASTGARPRPFPVPSSGGVAPPIATAGGTASPLAREVLGTALGFVGTPYRNGGTDPGGFDCSGFVQYVYARHGVPLPRSVGTQFLAGREVGADGLRAGDLVFFSTTGPGATHVGIAMGDGRFVHAPSSRGVVRVESLSGTYWEPRVIGARRVIEP